MILMIELEHQRVSGQQINQHVFHQAALNGPTGGG